MAAGDVLALRVADNASKLPGAVLEIDVDTGGTMTTGGAYAYGLVGSNDPTNAKVQLDVASPGFDATGAAVTVHRTVYGTVYLRKTTPNEATADETLVSTTLTLRVVLSDFVYSGDVVTATIASGLYTSTAATAAVAAGTAVTNQSTLTHPQPIGRWAWVPHELVQGGQFTLEAVAFHRSGRNGSPVSCVAFTVTDGTVTKTVTGTVMGPSQRGGDQANVVLTYAATFNSADFAAGVLTCNFKAYPLVGDSGAVLDSNTGITPPDERLCPFLLVNDPLAAYGGAFCVVDSTHGQASVATTWVSSTQAAAESSYAGANTNSYQSIGHAAAALKAFNNATYARNNAGGGTILLMDLLNSWPGNSLADQGAQDAWMTITRLSTKTRSQAGFNAGSNNDLGVRKVKCYDVSFTGSSTGQIHGNTTTGVLWIDSCAINMTGTAPIWQWQLQYGTRNAIAALAGGWSSFSTSKGPPGLVRGNSYSGTDRGLLTDVYCVLGCDGVWPNFVGVGNNAGTQQISDNGVWAYNRSLRQNGTIIDSIVAQQWTQGIALVQSIFEKTVGVSTLGTICGDSSSATSNHIIIWLCTFAGERLNCGYNDTGAAGFLHKNWSQIGTIFDLWNNKDDTWPGGSGANAARVGSWPVGHNVGTIACYKRADNGGGVGGGANNFAGEFIGIWSLEGGVWSFLRDASNNAGGGGSGAGGGDYRLRPAASAYQFVPPGVSPLLYDIAGSLRNLVSGGAAGAFEIPVPTAPSRPLYLPGLRHPGTFRERLYVAPPTSVPTSPVSNALGAPVEASGGVAAGPDAPLEAVGAVAGTGADPIEAAQALAQTGAPPLESGGGVATSASDPVEAGGGVAQTGPDPVEAAGAVAKTGAEPLEAAQALSTTAGDPVEAQQALAAAGPAGPLEAAQGVLQAGAPPLEAAGGVKTTDADPVEASQQLAQTAADPLEALQGTGTTAADPVEAGQAVAQTGADPVEALGAVAATGADPIEAAQAGLTPVSQTGSFPIESLDGLATGPSLPLEAGQGVAQTSAAPLEAAGAIAALPALAFESVQPFSATTGPDPYESFKSAGAQTAAAPVEAAGGVAATGPADLPIEAAGFAPPTPVATTGLGGGGFPPDVSGKVARILSRGRLRDDEDEDAEALRLLGLL